MNIDVNQVLWGYGIRWEHLCMDCFYKQRIEMAHEIEIEII